MNDLDDKCAYSQFIITMFVFRHRVIQNIFDTLSNFVCAFNFRSKIFSTKQKKRTKSDKVRNLQTYWLLEKRYKWTVISSFVLDRKAFSGLKYEEHE